jgi:hypothetical protein
MRYSSSQETFVLALSASSARGRSCGWIDAIICLGLLTRDLVGLSDFGDLRARPGAGKIQAGSLSYTRVDHLIDLQIQPRPPVDSY